MKCPSCSNETFNLIEKQGKYLDGKVVCSMCSTEVAVYLLLTEPVKLTKHKFLFKVRSSRQTDISEEVTIFYSEECKVIPEDYIKEELEDWCKKVFPRFEYSDSIIDYSYTYLRKEV